MKRGLTYLLLTGVLISLGSCSDKKRKPSIVFMPDMYYPVAYDPYMEANFGYWPERDAEQSAIPLFADHENMTALWPVQGSVPRTDEADILPWEFKNTNEGYKQALAIVKSPLDVANREKDLERGEKLYNQTCAVCHGAAGDGQGTIVQSKAYSGVPTYGERNITVGSVYHVIMYGRNAMGSYAPQLSPVDRWRVAEYVMNLKGVDTTGGAAQEVAVADNVETENTNQ
ncbi:MAG TPA: cytochrome c [Moheibacter sp.]|nr:cytochrome c [Moheibacter sp.]